MRITVIMPTNMVMDLEQHIDPTISRNELIRKAVHKYIIKKGEEIYKKVGG